MSRALDDLSAPMRAKAVEVLARLTERGVMVAIVDTVRTEQEHVQNLAKGTSWTAKSKHLPRKLRGWRASDSDADKSDAIDLAPYDTYVYGPGADKLLWDATNPVWRVIGETGESVGLRWGGRWPQRDLGHLELVVAAPKEGVKLALSTFVDISQG